MLPKEFPRVKIPFLAALLSPIAWQVGRPDLFDSYSAGVLLLQMAGTVIGAWLLFTTVTRVNTFHHLTCGHVHSVGCASCNAGACCHVHPV